MNDFEKEMREDEDKAKKRLGDFEKLNSLIVEKKSTVNNIISIFLILLIAFMSLTEVALSFEAILRISVMSALLIVVTFSIYNIQAESGKMYAKSKPEWDKKKNAVDELESELNAKYGFKDAERFCREYITNELTGSRKKLLGIYDIDYDYFMENFAGKSKREIKKADIRKSHKKVIIEANKIKPIKFEPYMFLSADMKARKSRSAMGIFPAQKELAAKSSKAITITLISFFVGMIILDAVSDFSYAAVIKMFLNILPLVTNAVSGYRFGYNHITITTLNHIDLRMAKMKHFKLFMESEKTISTITEATE